MPRGKGTYGTKRGRPPKKKSPMMPKKAKGSKVLTKKQKSLPKKLQSAIIKSKKKKKMY